MPKLAHLQSRPQARSADPAPDHSRPRGSSAASGSSSSLPLFLQRVPGAVVQAKRVVNEPGDVFEREADALSEAVAPAGDGARPLTLPRGGVAGGDVAQRKAAALSETARAIDPPDAGTALNDEIRARVEPVLGMDLSGVRVHDSTAARGEAHALQARAFTHKNHIWLGPNERADDPQLLAHEATHVRHQSDAASGDTTRGVAPIQRTPGDSASALPDPPMASGPDLSTVADTGALTESEAMSSQPAEIASQPTAGDGGDAGGGEEAADEEAALEGEEEAGEPGAGDQAQAEAQAEGQAEGQGEGEVAAGGAGEGGGEAAGPGGGRGAAVTGEGGGTGSPVVEETGAGALETGDLVLIDVELAEHQRWAGALGRVGEASSIQRAGFIAEAVGSGFISGAASGLAMGLGIGLATRAVPAIGPVIGGALALHGLVTRDWAETGATIGRFGEGSSTYETLANTIASVAAVIDVVSQVLTVINGIVGVVQIAAAVIAGGAVVAAFFTFGATLGIAAIAADVVAVCEEISVGINAVTAVLDTVNAAILQPCVTLFRALHAFTTQADPREVESQGQGISTAAAASGAALGAWAGGRAAQIGGGARPPEDLPPSQRPAPETPPAAAGDGPTVRFEEPPVPLAHGEGTPAPLAPDVAAALPVAPDVVAPSALAPDVAAPLPHPEAVTPPPAAPPEVVAPPVAHAEPISTAPPAAPEVATPPPVAHAQPSAEVTPAPAAAPHEQLTLPHTEGPGSELRAITAPLELQGIKATDPIPQGLEPGAIGTYGRAVADPHPAALASNPPGAPGATAGGGRMPATGREAAGVYLEHQTSAAVAHEVLPGHELHGPQGQRRGGRDTQEALVVALPQSVKTIKDNADAALRTEVRTRLAQGEEVPPIEVIARSAQITQDAIAQSGADVPGQQISRNFLAEVDQFNDPRFGYQEVRPGEALPPGHPLAAASPAEIDAFLNRTFDPFITPPASGGAPPPTAAQSVHPAPNPNQTSFDFGVGTAQPPISTPAAAAPAAAPMSPAAPTLPSVAPPPSQTGAGGTPPTPQRILVVGAERPEEFQYATQMAALGRDVTVVNPQATPQSEAFAASGGHFVQAGIETLPQRPGYNVVSEDFPVPIRRMFPQAQAMATERISRLEPGGRWVVTTESAEYVRMLELVGRMQGATVTAHEVPRHHEATPDSPHVVESTRFIVTVERPNAPAPSPQGVPPAAPRVGSPPTPPTAGSSTAPVPRASTQPSTTPHTPAIPPGTPSPTTPSTAPSTFSAAAGAARTAVAQQTPGGPQPGTGEPTWGTRAHQVGELFLPQIFGGGGAAPTYEQRQAAHRARFTEDNQPAEGVERVNPEYPPPPATPAQITAIQNEIMNLLTVRAAAEQEAQAQEGRAEQCEENQGPIQQTVDDTAAGISAVQAHDAAVVRREAVNQEQQQRQQESQGLVAGYPSRATGLAALTVPLAAWEGFTSLASHLPGEAGESMLRMNREAQQMQEAFGQMAAEMVGVETQGPAREGELQDDQGRLEATGELADQSDQQLQTASTGADGLQQANEAALAEARRREEAATERGQECADAVSAREERADSLAEQLRAWAAAHAAARQQAIAATVSRLEGEGRTVVESSER